MKTITILSKVFTNLSLAFAIQQILYGIQNNKWIDFTTWSTTTLAFELVFILSVVFSTIASVNRRAVRPMESHKRQDIPKNIFTPKEN